MDGPVRLKLGRREFFSGGGISGSYAPISVKVKNIAYSKEVVVHYTPYGDSWEDFPLTFAAHFDDYDIFQGSVNEQVTQFVIRYSANGSLFYDNNSGRNYAFISNLAVVGGNVTLNNATAKRGAEAGGGFVFTTSWLEGEILVNNLAFAKEVGVRLSSDGGMSWHDTQGVYAGTHTNDNIFIGVGAEVWRFKTPELNLDNSVAEFHFAVFYRNVSTGETFWDNNFNQDYKVSKVDGATVQ